MLRSVSERCFPATAHRIVCRFATDKYGRDSDWIMGGRNGSRLAVTRLLIRLADQTSQIMIRHGAAAPFGNPVSANGKSMSRPTLLILVLSLLAGSSNRCSAQHDPQRDATRFVAAGQFDKVDKELAPADAEEPETHFVRMMSSLRQGKVDDAVGHAK